MNVDGNDEVCVGNMGDRSVWLSAGNNTVHPAGTKTGDMSSTSSGAAASSGSIQMITHISH